MPKDIHLSDGSVKKDCVLCVRNVTGIAEERGFRLYWTNDNGDTIIPALGLATSNPFRTARLAALCAERYFAGQTLFLLTEKGLRKFRK